MMLGFIDTMRVEGPVVESTGRVLREQGYQIGHQVRKLTPGMLHGGGR